MEVESIANKSLEAAIRRRLRSHLYPRKALGVLHDLALHIGLVRQSTEPELTRPALLIFAGDHGVSKWDISAQPNLFTADLLLDFLNEGSVINIFARENELAVRVVDVGVDHAFEATLGYWLHQGSHFFNRKINRGTRDITEYPAMTTSETKRAVQVGRDMVRMEVEAGCNTIGMGDVGIGSTTSAAVLCCAFTGSSPEHFIISSGISSQAYDRKHRAVAKALSRHPKTHDPLTLLSLYGGYEIAALVGAILQAGEDRVLILIDGFVSGTAALLASRICPEILEYCVFCTDNDEQAHKNLLDQLEVKALLNLNLAMGEGSGIALAYPLIKNAAALLRNIGSS